ncbi:MAG: phytanoyl-CoA dioxygenase [Acidobacteria bacterium RIFCSPLOWO2_12_FULL_67_14b]|nr:MAG: phytanoyl-CoA dioxygenase [Acidobacteria bacterium RIFCSPLOWO2_12_FULL_67_14b]
MDRALIGRFVSEGFVKIAHAFPRDTAAAARAILWRDTGCDPEDPATWTKPVVKLGYYGEAPFREAVNAPELVRAYDLLVGRGRWLPRTDVGTFLVRFPSRKNPGDAGWHIDTSFQGDADPTDFFQWRVNVSSKGRALLMLFLFSDVGPDDAPTRIRIGSHLDIAKRLEPAGEAGLSLKQLAKNGFAESAKREQIPATGDAGTVYLCHPFLVHGAQPHHGTRPRFLAQPALLPAQPFQLQRSAGDYSPVEQAIRTALALRD